MHQCERPPVLSELSESSADYTKDYGALLKAFTLLSSEGLVPVTKIREGGWGAGSLRTRAMSGQIAQGGDSRAPKKL